MRKNALYLLLLFMPTPVLACMIGPSISSTLMYGAIKTLFGLGLLFYSLRLYIRSTKTLLPLFYLIIIVLVAGSVYSIVFRYGLIYGPSCGTEFGYLTSAFLLGALLMFIFLKIAFFVKFVIANK